MGLFFWGGGGLVGQRVFHSWRPCLGTRAIHSPSTLPQHRTSTLLAAGKMQGDQQPPHAEERPQAAAPLQTLSPHAPSPTPTEASSAPSGGGMDCLGCRLTGLAFGVGGGGYVMSTLLREPPLAGSHRAAVLVTAAAVFGLGMYRAVG